MQNLSVHSNFVGFVDTLRSRDEPRFVQSVLVEVVESVLFGKQFGILGSSGMAGRIILKTKIPESQLPVAIKKFLAAFSRGYD